MKNKISAGILMYRIDNGKFEVLLAHPGGPYFKNKDEGHWTIPKGEPNEDEKDLLDVAKREFEEETGINPHGNFIELGTIMQKNGKIVHAWAVEGNLPKDFIHTCNRIEIEWPPKSGKKILFPEVDRIEFFEVNEAKKKNKETQIPLIERLEKNLFR